MSEEARPREGLRLPVPGSEAEFVLVGRLGQGAMGEVWLAEGPDERVAVKILREGGAESEGVRRFAREIEILQSLDHPGIVRSKSTLGEALGLRYYAMELVLGRNLQDLIQAMGPLLPEHAVDLGCELLDALQAAHEAGVVHRDVKPGNVIVDRAGRPRLTDFGLARAADRSQLTLADVVLGTPAYMSPEQAKGEAAGPASDLYSTGAVLFHVLCGRPPFAAERPLALLRAHIDVEPPDPASFCPGLPAELSALVLRALAKDPDQRFASAAAMREALAAARPASSLQPASTLVFKSKVEELGVEATAIVAAAQEGEEPEIPGYRILSALGGGGQGQVYLAESTDGIGKRVALKVFARGEQERFRAELEAYRRLEALRAESGCPYLAEGLAAGELEGGGFLALAYQERGTLADRLREEGALAPSEASALVSQILEGLEVMHGAGLCHRDVKPHNVLVGLDGSAILGDFGLARSAGGALSTAGTPAFAAPEQFSATDSDALERSASAIDVYGAGATLYALLTSRPPPPSGPNLFALEELAVPRSLQGVLLRALEREPDDRYPGAADMRRALLEAHAVPSDAARRSRLPFAVGAGIVVVGGLAWGLTRTIPPRPSQSPGLSQAPSQAPSPSQAQPRPSEAPSPSQAPPSPTQPRLEPSQPQPSPGRSQAQPSPSLAPSPGRPAPSPPQPEPSQAQPAASRPPLARLQVDRDERKTRVRLGSALLGEFEGLVQTHRLDTSHVVLLTSARAGLAPELRVYSERGELLSQHPLDGGVTCTQPLPGGRFAYGTRGGEVRCLHVAQGPPRLLHRFGTEARALRFEESRLWAEGDDRRPLPLEPGAELPPGHILVRGAGELRYAYPVSPKVVSVSLELE